MRRLIEFLCGSDPTEKINEPKHLAIIIATIQLTVCWHFTMRKINLLKIFMHD